MEWCEAVLKAQAHQETQSNGGIRYWGFIEEIGTYLRVVTLGDGETLETAYPDRNFAERMRRR